MGKKNFAAIYQAAKNARDGQHPPLGVKISFHSDEYDATSEFAGLIVYHKNDAHRWQNTGEVAGRAPRNGMSFYVLIQDTTQWPEREQRAAGQGRVHDFLFARLCGEEFRKATTCCGGFAIIRGTVKTSSIWLNQSHNNTYSNSWAEDGRKFLSVGERALVKLAVAGWVQRGSNVVLEIPDWVEQTILNPTDNFIPQQWPIVQTVNPRPNPRPNPPYGWKFHPNLDHFGNDLRGPTRLDVNDWTSVVHIREMARDAQGMTGAVAFNTIGCIKRNLNGPKASVERWSTVPPTLRGMFCLDQSVPHGWLFLPNRDSWGNDVEHNASPPATLSKLLARSNILQAVAFNTGGWIKNRVEELSDGNLGLYVRI